MTVNPAGGLVPEQAEWEGARTPASARAVRRASLREHLPMGPFLAARPSLTLRANGLR